eukprot:45093-Pelagomonas_calceolata.AAC.2
MCTRVLAIANWPQVVLKEQRRAEEAAAKKQEVAELQALWARMAEEQIAATLPVITQLWSRQNHVLQQS